MLRRRGRARRRWPRDHRALGLRSGAAGDPPDVDRPRRVDRRALASATASGKPRRPSSPARPATSSAGRSGRSWPSCRWRSASRRLPCSPGVRGARKRARRRCRSPSAWPRSAVPIALALVAPEQGLRPRPQPDAGAGPAAGRGRDRGDAADGPPPRRGPRGRCWSPTRSASASGSASRPNLQRPNWNAVAGRLGEPHAPRATVTWTIGEAPLRYYLSTEAIQVPATSKATTGSSMKSTSSPRETSPPPGPNVLGSAFREVGSEKAGSLLIRRYAVPGRGLAPVHLSMLRRVPLEFPQHRRSAGRNRPALRRVVRRTGLRV